ncbi:MAG: type IV secretory system conjugative DNA transfer family protein [Pseudolabrys sp.]|nr:type IV secretory system conjugative DNA transfer family protein [Pseudolabrys sp.]MCW5696129.1 type IV secretory system conjugative DNA transfer family protein [Bauldia sp.]
MSDSFPPRGSGTPGRHETPPDAVWGHPQTLSKRWDWRPGKVLLGEDENGRPIGDPDRDGTQGKGDDRHIVTKAGSRAGKSSTVLIPNLLRYPGSALVIDPKGELARATAAARRAMGQDVFVLDAFGASGRPSAAHNPFDELGGDSTDPVAANAAQFADALLVPNERDPHWTDAGRNLIRGLALHLRSTSATTPTLRDIRRLVNGTPAELDEVFGAMADSEAYDGVVRNIGRAFLGKAAASERELQGILSTVQEQTAPLDDIVHVTDRSDFRLSDLKARPTTIYLVLPGMRMGTHFRWLRLEVQQALIAMERTASARDALPVWFVLEEFAALGFMRSIETAAGFIAGFGVKLWTVLQDLSQLRNLYPKSWETFLGNAGVIQAFANADHTTADYLSKRMGTTTVVERQQGPTSGQAMQHGDLGEREHIRSVPLLTPDEVTLHFARETGRQLILVPGRPPIYLMRSRRDD